MELILSNGTLRQFLTSQAADQEAETRRPSWVRGPLQASLSLERQTMKLQQEFNFNTETDSK